jgi:hypothetical protein
VRLAEKFKKRAGMGRPAGPLRVSRGAPSVRIPLSAETVATETKAVLPEAYDKARRIKERTDLRAEIRLAVYSCRGTFQDNYLTEGEAKPFVHRLGRTGMRAGQKKEATEKGDARDVVVEFFGPGRVLWASVCFRPGERTELRSAPQGRDGEHPREVVTA